MIHLHVHTHYSLHDSVVLPHMLIARCVEYGMDAVAVTDHGTMSGVLETCEIGRQCGVKVIPGVEAYVRCGGERLHVTLLAMNEEGYRQLLALGGDIDFDGEWPSEGVICLSGCSLKGVVPNHEDPMYAASRLKEIYGDRFFIEIQWHGLERQKRINPQLEDIAKRLGVRCVPTCDVHYLDPEECEVRDLWTAVGFKSSEVGKSSGEAWLKPEIDWYDDRITHEIAEMCEYVPSKRETRIPRFPDGGADLLRRLVEGKLRRLPEEYVKRAKYELDVIERLGFVDYILMVWDFVRWAKSQGIRVGPGRGSVAGSLVAYLLGITEIDPIEHGLLFERFLNPDRISPPDIDLDFQGSRRDEVIEYARQRYGHVARICTFDTEQAKVALRDVARVLGYEIERVAKSLPPYTHVPRALREGFEIPSEVAVAAERLEGLIRHRGEHPGGVVVSDEPIEYRCPVRDGVTEWAMEGVEYVGLLKFDFLGLSTLDLLDRCEKETGERPTTLEDPLTFNLISEGDTVGVFQLTSSSMRRLLREAKVSCFSELVDAIALHRPGPMTSGVLDTYIARKRGYEDVEYDHPALEEILRDTYGVIIYQEQVIKIAQVLAGMTASEADGLRKGIGKKRPEVIAEYKKKFVEGCRRGGVDEEIAERVFAKIIDFGQYGFNKSHAASYAMIAYQCAWYKAHHPLVFWAALLTSVQNDVRQLEKFVRAAQDEGVVVTPPHVNRSKEVFTVERDKIRYSLTAIKGLREETVKRIVERAPYKDWQDFVFRVKPNYKELEALVGSGALDGFASRAEMMAWSALYRKRRGDQLELFSTKVEVPKTDEWGLLQMELLSLGFDLKRRGGRMEVTLEVSDMSKLERLREVIKRIRGPSSVKLKIWAEDGEAVIRLKEKIDVRGLPELMPYVDGIEVNRAYKRRSSRGRRRSRGERRSSHRARVSAQNEEINDESSHSS